jgi:REP element-mobilizing transposase RayT
MHGVFLLQAVERYELECHAWCLMHTHYHLLVRTHEANLDRAMQFLNGRFAAWSNYERGERGHLFRSRYESRLVASDSDVLGVARYIDLNPVAAGMVDHPASWRWSSHRAFLDPLERKPFHQTDFVLGLLGTNVAAARRTYRRFVLEGLEAAKAERAGLVVPTHGV